MKGGFSLKEEDDQSAAKTSGVGDETHRRYLLMLALVQEPGTVAGFIEGGTLWALVEERDLLKLFTICDEKMEPIAPHPFIQISLEKMLEAKESGLGESQTLVHALILHQRPSPRVEAMLKVIERLRNRAISYAQFSSRYRNKGWPQLMQEIARHADSDQLANLAVGMMYMVVTPEETFETLRTELRSLGVSNPVEAIERFIEYVSEVPEEKFELNDIEKLVGRKLIRLSGTPTTYGVREIEGGFLLTRGRVGQGFTPVDLFGAAHLGGVTESQVEMNSREAGAGSQVPTVQTSEGDDTGSSTVRPQVDLTARAATPSYEMPNIDEDVDWPELLRKAKKNDEGMYVEVKRMIDLHDDKFVVKFVRAFIGLANRAQKDNHRSLLIVGPIETGEKPAFLDDADYQEIMEGFIRPKPLFTFHRHPGKHFEHGVFVIQPSGARPYVVAKDIRPEHDSDYLSERACYLREGTRTFQLDEDAQFGLMADLAIRYGRV